MPPPPPRPAAAVELTMSNGFKYFMPVAEAKPILELALKLEVRPDDVFVISYPKSGTTWVQELVWLICNDADTKKASTTKQTLRYGFLEMPDQIMDIGIESLMKWPSDKRRFIKTHVSFQLMPQELQKQATGKIVYACRNLKDTCVSYYHFHRMNHLLPEPKPWNEFQRQFIQGEISYGSWFDHIEKYLKVRKTRPDSVYFVSYENLQKNLKEEIRKLSEFLEKHISDKQVDEIAQHCSFNSMSQRKSVNYDHMYQGGILNFDVSKFMRKGQVGDWKNMFSQDQNDAFDAAYKEKTKNWDLKFDFEI